MPDDLKLEIVENKNLATPIAFHHILSATPKVTTNGRSLFSEEAGGGWGHDRYAVPGYVEANRTLHRANGRTRE